MRRPSKLLVPVLLLAMGLLVAPVSAQEADHCPDHQGHPNKFQGQSGSQTIDDVVIQWSGDPGSITITNNNEVSATVIWCAKGGDNFSNGSQTTGQQSTTVGPGQSTTIGPFGTAISYVVIYQVELEEPPPPPPTPPDDEKRPPSPPPAEEEVVKKKVDEVRPAAPAPEVAPAPAPAAPPVAVQPTVTG